MVTLAAGHGADTEDPQMPVKLDDKAIETLPAPASGNKITYDTEVTGFGCRVTAKGAKSYVLNYRARSGREGRYTIGRVGVKGEGWSLKAARKEAVALKAKLLIEDAFDPVTALKSKRDALTVAVLCMEFEDNFLADPPKGQEHRAKYRASTRKDYKSMIKNDILPTLKAKSVADITFSDLNRLHREISKRAPYRANRVKALLSRLFSLAIKEGVRTDNPARGIEQNSEDKRHRYLSTAELAGLTGALTAHADKQAANIVRLLLLTGCRKGELMASTWDQFDLEVGVWTKPGATTKQKTLHRVPLSEPALEVLREVYRQAHAEGAKERESNGGSDYVFPGRSEGHRVEIKGAWAELCLAAKLVTAHEVKGPKGERLTILKPSARLHDLRHTYASVLASAGLSLPIIGALLGHTQPSTTARYSHLMDDPLRVATERAGAIVMAPAVAPEPG